MKIFIGYDSRYPDLYKVCEKSISKKVFPTPNHLIKKTKKSSTEFTYSRFLIPLVCKFEGWSLFCDSDFLFLSDIEELFKLKNDDYAVMVCKHKNYKPKTKIKMDGQKQIGYKRKNWSSLILWNCGHKKNKILTKNFVNEKDGLFLHQFKWLSDKDIGSLPLTWNTLVGYNNFKSPKALHFTDGAPHLENYKNVQYSKLWNKIKNV